MLGMHARSESSSSAEGGKMGLRGVYCASPNCPSNQQGRWSVSGVYDDVLNISPRLSYHNPSIRMDRKPHNGGYLYTPEKRLELSSIPSIDSYGYPQSKIIHPARISHGQNSLCFPEDALENSYMPLIASDEAPVEKHTAELVKEIASLELEVTQLEGKLLSLYRTTFDPYLPRAHTVANHPSRQLCGYHAGSVWQDAKLQISQGTAPAVNAENLGNKVNQCRALEKIVEDTHNENIAKKSSPFCKESDSNSCNTSPNDMSLKEYGHQSLAKLLGASITDHTPDTHCKLSEDIVRCISAIYCKLGTPPAQQLDVLASPTPSVSSSSMSSLRDPRDSWSPRCHYEVATSPYRFELLKSKQSPYSNMVEVPKIYVDGDRFGYASEMLNIFRHNVKKVDPHCNDISGLHSTFRSLIRRLDTVEPRKMKHEMQLAFWINIHNALVMHAYLAYGLHQNPTKSTSSIIKATYKIGGHSVNFGVIRKAILGCQHHSPTLSIRSLFSPSLKYISGSAKHAYALDHPEPLAHFGLCLGAYSDPAIRVFTAESVYVELKLARAEFIQANVSVRNESRIILPKILHYYSKDASLDLSDLMEMVCSCLPEAQRQIIRGCLKKKVDKCIEWSSYNSSFRYLVHRHLANWQERSHHSVIL